MSKNNFKKIAQEVISSEIKSLQKLEYVDLRIKHIPTIGNNDDEYISLSNNTNTVSDLTIRLCIPINNGMVSHNNYFNCSENND